MLTDLERERFTVWLEDNANSSELLAVQLRKIFAPIQLIQQHEFETKACRFLAHKFKNTEILTVKQLASTKQ